MLLDDEKTIARIDAGNLRASIDALPDQLETSWREANRVRVPVSYSRASEIVVAGMGGSSLPAHLIKSVYGGALRVPFSFFNDYTLPGSVGKNSLVVVSSYSGTTEETLACLAEAKKRGAKIMGITCGNPLKSALRRLKAPAYIFDPVYNPCNQPRMGIGYTAGGLLALLNKITDFGIDKNDLAALPARLRAGNARWAPGVATPENPAKLLAHNLLGKMPVVISAEHLAGNGHVMQNQMHECAKHFSVAFPLPELNHHLMEGLKFPREINQLLTFVFLDSRLYSDKLKLRVKVTDQVVRKQNYEAYHVELLEQTKIGQAFEALAFGSWVALYMAVASRINPSNIPWVDFFKKEIARG